ncbi:MAG: T9SS type A sorting domain-containing protein [Bacteroidetes bacterium]|nr:T9SS type A sorting domain-containing protein [Bacteroidota bacterium]
MKKITLLLSLLILANNFIKSQSSVISNTFQISNPAPCTSCCNGSISVTGVTYTCPNSPPISIVLITPMSSIPVSGSSWTGLCNGIYTVEVNFNGDPNPSACGAAFSCSIGYYITTSVNEVITDKIDVKIFPNPVKDNLYIKMLKDEKEMIAMEIINSIGQVVKVADINYENSSIDLKDLPNGIYILNLKGSKSRSISKRFVIAR